MTLPLYGTALLSSGFRAETARSVVRLRPVECSAERHASDFALVKTPEDVQRAMECYWRSVFAVSDSYNLAPKAFEGRFIAVPQKYDYLPELRAQFLSGHGTMQQLLPDVLATTEGCR